jgi:DNA repair protein RecN (Recombination protein N)
VIESLRIESLAVVDSAELELGSGLHVLTGETGAGKSLVLGAIALLAGARASADAVRSGAPEARVEAVLRTASLPGFEAALAERGIEAEEGAVIVRRTLAAGGRSRAWLGGHLVPAQALAELVGERLEISSQHESQALRRADVQARLLDGWGGLDGVRDEVRAGHAELRALDEEIAALRRAREERAQREDFLTFQVREIDEAAPREGELATLGAERARLGHAERLREDAGAALGRLGGDPELAADEAAAELLAGALRRLEDAAGVDGSLVPLTERLRAAELELADVAAELRDYVEGLEADPGRLQAVEARLQVLERLRRKYGAEEAAILAFRERAAEELRALGGADERLGKLEAEREALARRLAQGAARLSAGRRKAAGGLEAAVAEALAGLALPEAAFRVALVPVASPDGLPCGPGGAEQVELLFSANPGLEPRALRRVASGGELSRVFLALKNVLRRVDRGATLVFDEVDAGIGGRVADRVGAVLAELARQSQVLCITHLPQIAARADVHFAVRKQGATARVERLDEAGRVEELARMAGGEAVTAATRRHARELLRRARGS